MNSVRPGPPRALPIANLETYLLGAWELTREIIDHNGDRLHLAGGAEVEHSSGGVFSYFEHVVLERDATSLEFIRRYVFRPTGAASAIVEFEDGSTFFELDLRKGRCSARHLCDQDLYMGLVLSTADGWYTRWRCRGPKKNYVATTHLTRRVES